MMDYRQMYERISYAYQLFILNFLSGFLQIINVKNIEVHLWQDVTATESNQFPRSFDSSWIFVAFKITTFEKALYKSIIYGIPLIIRIYEDYHLFTEH